MATECHQRARPLWRRHGDVPRTSHGGLPTTCHDGPDCHHRRLQCSPISGRSRRTTDARGRSGTSGHATSRPAGHHSLSTRPALTQTTTTWRGRFPHRPLLRGLGTRRGDAGAIPRPAIQDYRTPTLEVQIEVLQVPPASRDGMDHEEQPPIQPPGENNTHRWVAYYQKVQRILGQQDKTDLNLAMRQAATACGLSGQRRTQDDATPHQDLPSLVTTIWHDKRALYTAMHSHDLQAQHDAQEIAAGLETARRQLREWHVRRANELAREQQRYFPNPQP